MLSFINDGTPYGSGSPRATDDKVKMYECVQHRLMSLQYDFRRSPVWSFQLLDRLIKNNMYFRHQASGRKANPTVCLAESASVAARGLKRTVGIVGLSDPNAREDIGQHDNYDMLFGRVDPRRNPESGAWWKGR